MRLKSIKLAGFKSFVDPTTVSFPGNLCAVVGPNGCGKSNIIDAVRWVMGESSAKQLRGESMADVIFSGSNTRKPTSQASIELLFDNSDGRVQGEYASYSELAIRRQATRDGQSVYFLNGQRCRRRDITDVFLGTGFGPRSYSIIEQGMISQLVEARPEELRVYLEEAAGISKYKERRRETENRIRHTRENLERLSDLREELERQLSHLQRQARAAERYKEYKADESQYRIQLLGLRWKNLGENSEQARLKAGELQTAVEKVVAEQRQTEARIESARADVAAVNERFSGVQEKFYSIGAEVARAEEAITFREARLKQLTADLDSIAANEKRLQDQLNQDEQARDLLQQQLQDLGPMIMDLKEREKQRREALQESEANRARGQEQWDAINAQLAEVRGAIDLDTQRVTNHESALARIAQRLQGMGDVDDSSRSEMLREQQQTGSLREEDLQQTLEQLGSELNAAEQHISEVRTQQRNASEQRETLRRSLQENSQRLSQLQGEQHIAVGRGEEDVERWLGSQNLADSKRLAEVLTVAPGWETAVEVVLGSQLQGLMVEKPQTFVHALTELQSGTVAMIAAQYDNQASAGSANGQRLGALVQGAGALTASLMQIVCVADTGAALQMLEALQPGESVVTADGLWMGPGWTRIRRGSTEEAGVLARAQTINELQATCEELEQSLQVLQNEQEALRTQRDAKVAEREALAQKLSETRREHAGLQAENRALAIRLRELVERQEAAQQEARELKQQESEEQEGLRTAQERLESARSNLRSVHDARDKQAERRDEAIADAARQQQEMQQLIGQLQEAQLTERTVQARLDSFVEAQQRSSTQLQEMHERAQALRLARDETGQPLEDEKAVLAGLLEQRVTVERSLEETRRELETAEAEVTDLERARQKIANDVQQAQQRYSDHKLEMEGFRVKRVGIEEQIVELGAVAETVVAELPEEAEEVAWEEQLTKLGNRIQRLGAINLAAIEEFTTQSERKEYLDAQHEDLQQALATLEGAIHKIDKETRALFKETYDQVNGHLQTLFPKVFGGGQASLELTGEDLLETGISLMAQPPGKRNSNIHLLSGGEKALTALALVLSIFQLNPSPVCMLDEVDAPLDDANVGRYARLIAEMSDTVQFIYITHNKVSMEMADQLLGVTMQEAGVSRLVTVDVEKAVEMVAV